MLQHTEGEIRKTIEINVIAHFWMFQAFLPTMIEHNRGHIVALSSMAGIMGFQNLVPYCGSKFAVRGIMEAMSEELRCKSKGQSQVWSFKVQSSQHLSSLLVSDQIYFSLPLHGRHWPLQESQNPLPEPYANG
jgi:NADP-dependent 3-hydroxy acid dehydrogenase YdfG